MTSWRHGKKRKISVIIRIFKINIFAADFEKQPFKNVLKK